MGQTTCYVRLIPDAQALLISLKPGTYGSLETELIDRLSAELTSLRRITTVDDIIIDLSAVTLGGSRLLSSLVNFRQELLLIGKRLTVCGDERGVVRRSGLADLLNLQADFGMALMHCASEQGLVLI